MRIRTLLTTALLAALPLTAAVAKDAALAKAVASEHRTPAFVERDKYRHPQEVLEFAGIKPTQTVVEISPGGGYWTEILGPYLKDKGTYYTALSARAMENWNKKLADNKAHWGDVKVTEFTKDKYDVAPAGSADLVITSRNVHNWMGAGFPDEAFAAFYKALKPGGILSVEEHRASTDSAAGSEGRQRLRARGSHDRAGREGRLQAAWASPKRWRIRRTRRIGRRACGRCRRRWRSARRIARSTRRSAKPTTSC